MRINATVPNGASLDPKVIPSRARDVRSTNPVRNRIYVEARPALSSFSERRNRQMVFAGRPEIVLDRARIRFRTRAQDKSHVCCHSNRMRPRLHTMLSADPLAALIAVAPVLPGAAGWQRSAPIHNGAGFVVT